MSELHLKPTDNELHTSFKEENCFKQHEKPPLLDENSKDTLASYHRKDAEGN